MTIATTDALTAAHEAWSAPFVLSTDGRFDDELFAARTVQTRELAAMILARRCGGKVGGLTVAQAGWSAEASRRADEVIDRKGTVAEMRAVLGSYDEVTLTGDGRGVVRELDRTCNPPASTWVRYEAWTEAGRVAHGFACPGCRHITQTG